MAMVAHAGKLYHLGVGKSVTRSNLSKTTERRTNRLFEEYATFMIDGARKRRVDKVFELDGHVYTFDSTTIDLCLLVFERAKFRKHKGGIKMHTLYDIESEVTAFVDITAVNVHNFQVMPEIPYEAGAHYIFNRGYNDFGNFYTINRIGAFSLYGKNQCTDQAQDLKAEITERYSVSDVIGNFSVYKNSKDYPEELQKLIIEDPEDGFRYIS